MERVALGTVVIKIVHDEEQRKLAEASKAAAMKKLGQKIFTPAEAAAKFYPAEYYHQDY
jgi:peptide methionine sulfoxide reductase MsrA